ncbi:MAG TPA: hypothetical protein VE077_07960 [Candidatus Methylomirabilis sp.]|nr:hypothetical protein [Candidatus Methylomirabilis sp.]
MREKAVVALLQEPTIDRAAHVTGIGLRTLQRWLIDATAKLRMALEERSAFSIPSLTTVERRAPPE